MNLLSGVLFDAEVWLDNTSFKTTMVRLSRQFGPILTNFFLSCKLKSHDCDNIWFPHDGTTCHNSALLLEKFPRCLISRLDNINRDRAIWSRWTFLCLAICKKPCLCGWTFNSGKLENRINESKFIFKT